MNITSPYNFVPLNKQVFYPDWADKVSQDLPLKDAHDYYFEFELKNVSPLFTRDGKQGEYSAHIIGEDGKRHYFIPATTIKGMLREIVEIMTFGKMQEGKDYQNLSFEHRVKKRKVPYKYNVRQQVEVLQQADANRRDLAEALFGYAGKDDSLKGRVQVSHAFMEGSVPDNELIETKGVLGTPKASYYPLYLKQRHSPYKTYDENEGIAGRKLYRIHKGSTTAELPQAKNNENVGTCFKALPPGQTFRFCITLHNVKEVEVGAILAALTFNHTPGVYHNLGMAKSFGFGKCKIEQTAGNADDERYLHEFEKLMSVFTYENSKQLWAQTESITQLVNILGEHDEEDVKMMKLEEENKSEKGYKYFKDNNHFDHLKEKGYPINTLLSEEEKEERAGKEAREALSQQYKLAEEHEANGQLQEAKAVYNQITDELLKKGIDLQPENQKIADIEAKIAEQEAAKKEQEEQAAQEAKAAKLAAGLAAVLDKLAGDGVNYSIKDFKVCFQKVDKWLKDSKAAQLTEADANALYSTSARILNEPSKKEVKDLSKPFDQGCIWKKLATYIGQEKAQELYSSYLK